MNIKAVLNYAFLVLISIGLAACNTEDGFSGSIVAANTPAVISGTTTGALTGSETVVTGALTVTDPDNGEDSFQVQTNEAKTYGTFSIDASGQWTYTLDDTSAAFIALNGGETVTETITVITIGQTSQSITITITGVNDIAVLGEGVGVNSATTDNNNTNTDPVIGTLSVTDPDTSPDSIVAQTNTASMYGTFSITEAGAWTYTLDLTNSAVQALIVGSTPLTDVIPVSTADGLSTNVTISIDGAVNNTAATFAGEVTGSIDAGNTADVTGTVSVTDPDAGEDVLVAQTNAGQTYGSFSIGTDGAWTYILDNTNTDVLAIGSGETLTDTIAISSADGTSSDIIITINGVGEVIATFEAFLQNPDMQTYTAPSDGTNTNDLVDAWTVDPDNTFDNTLDTPFNFWRNDALESWVSDPTNNGGAGTTDKGSSSSTDATSAGGTSDRSLKFDSSGERAYQPFEVETGVEYTLTAFVKTEATPIGAVEGTFYILSGEPASDNDLASLTLVSQEVVSDALNNWQQVSFSFNADATFSFPQSRVDENADDILDSVDQKFVIFYFVPTNTVVSDNEVFLTDIVLDTPSFGTTSTVTATKAAVIQNPDMQTYTAPSDGTNTNDLVDAWTVDPDNTFDNSMDTPFNFWRNDALESWVSDPTNNGGAGTTDKGSSSGTDATSAGGTSDRSLKFDSSGERAYQPFEVETGVEYSLTAFVKTEATPIGAVEGTFYILSGEPTSDNDLASLTLVSQEVVSDALNNWQQASFSFIADSSFSFPQSRVDENAADILESTDQKFVIFYFVPTNTVTSDNEVFVTDVVISTPGF